MNGGNRSREATPRLQAVRGFGHHVEVSSRGKRAAHSWIESVSTVRRLLRRNPAAVGPVRTVDVGSANGSVRPNARPCGAGRALLARPLCVVVAGCWRPFRRVPASFCVASTSLPCRMLAAVWRMFLVRSPHYPSRDSIRKLLPPLAPRRRGDGRGVPREMLWSRRV